MKYCSSEVQYVVQGSLNFNILCWDSGMRYLKNYYHIIARTLYLDSYTNIFYHTMLLVMLTVAHCPQSNCPLCAVTC